MAPGADAVRFDGLLFLFFCRSRAQFDNDMALGVGPKGPYTADFPLGFAIRRAVLEISHFFVCRYPSLLDFYIVIVCNTLPCLFSPSLSIKWGQELVSCSFGVREADDAVEAKSIFLLTIS